ncbi:MAG: hypothetical protein WCA35_06005 [Kovacikia sp.]
MPRLWSSVRRKSPVQPKDKDTSALIDRLLLERIPLAGIARDLQLSES